MFIFYEVYGAILNRRLEIWAPFMGPCSCLENARDALRVHIGYVVGI